MGKNWYASKTVWLAFAQGACIVLAGLGGYAPPWLVALGVFGSGLLLKFRAAGGGPLNWGGGNAVQTTGDSVPKVR